MAFSNGLDVAIGLVFIYILLSLLATTISEVIEGFLKSRGAYCLAALREIFDAEVKAKPGNGPVAGGIASAAHLLHDFFSHPFIYALYRGKNPVPLSPDRLSLVGTTDDGKIAVTAKQNASLPSYIPASTFARTILIMLRDVAGGGAAATLQQMTAAVENNNAWPDGKFRQAVVACLKEAQTDVDGVASDMQKAQALLEQWYNACMDRASGWYRRRKQKVLLIAGFAACAVFNVDSVHIAQTLYNDSTLRAAIVAEAQVASKTGLDGLKGSCSDQTSAAVAAASNAFGSNSAATLTSDAESELADSGVSMPSDAATASETTQLASTAAPTGDSIDQDVKAAQCFNKRLVDLKLPIGWNGDVRHNFAVKPFSSVVSGIIGWLTTAFAITLGAPFWFDLLNKLVNLRATFKPEEVKQAAGEGRRKA